MGKLTLILAAQEYISRQRGKLSPRGEWAAHTYFIAHKVKEKEQCCIKYENQIQHNPRVMWEHCKSIEHIAMRYNVDSSELESEIKNLFAIGKKRKKRNEKILKN